MRCRTLSAPRCPGCLFGALVCRLLECARALGRRKQHADAPASLTRAARLELIQRLAAALAQEVADAGRRHFARVLLTTINRELGSLVEETQREAYADGVRSASTMQDVALRETLTATPFKTAH